MIKKQVSVIPSLLFLAWLFVAFLVESSIIGVQLYIKILASVSEERGEYVNASTDHSAKSTSGGHGIKDSHARTTMALDSHARPTMALPYFGS